MGRGRVGARREIRLRIYRSEGLEKKKGFLAVCLAGSAVVHTAAALFLGGLVIFGPVPDLPVHDQATTVNLIRPEQPLPAFQPAQPSHAAPDIRQAPQEPGPQPSQDFATDSGLADDREGPAPEIPAEEDGPEYVPAGVNADINHRTVSTATVQDKPHLMPDAGLALPSAAREGAADADKAPLDKPAAPSAGFTASLNSSQDGVVLPSFASGGTAVFGSYSQVKHSAVPPIAASTAPPSASDVLPGQRPIAIGSSGAGGQAGAVAGRSREVRVSSLGGPSFQPAGIKANQPPGRRQDGQRKPPGAAALARIPVAITSSISLTTPADGSIFNALESRSVEVSGRVTGSATRVILSLSGSRLVVGVKDGQFKATIKPGTEVNELTACPDSPGAPECRTRFSMKFLNKGDIVVILNKSGGQKIRFKPGWRPHPLSGKGMDKNQPVQPEILVDEREGTASVRAAVPGIYAFALEYECPKTVEAAVDVYLYPFDDETKKVRRFPGIRLSGKGGCRVVRVLMPECVFWEDDGWFTGKIERSTSTTKVRQPEGILWKEEN